MPIKFGRFVVRHRWLIILVWVVAAILIVKFSPTLSSVTSTNESKFLPGTYESVKAQNLAQKVFPKSNEGSDLIVISRKDDRPLTAADQNTISSLTTEISSSNLSHVSGATTSQFLVSPNKQVQLVNVTFSGGANDADVIDATGTLRTKVGELTKGTSLNADVAGEEAVQYDTQDTFNNALKIVSIATILLVLILPAIVLRSPFVGLLPVISVGLIYSMASSLLALTAKNFHFTVNQQLTILITVVLFGVGTDYILFLLFRYREQLRKGQKNHEAVVFAVNRAGHAILSAALVVIASFSALFFSKFQIFSSLAPGLVIAVALMLIAAMTLIPAIISIIGEKLFWPTKPSKHKVKPTISKRIGTIVSNHPGKVALAVIILVVFLGIGALSYRSDFSSFSSAPKNTQSAAGTTKLESAFPPGQLAPTLVYVSSSEKLTQSQISYASERLKQVPGIAAVAPAVLSADGKNAQYNLVLSSNPYSASAIATVKGLSAHASSINDGTTVLVGGGTQAIADVQTASNRDLRVILPIAALFIFIILVFLLRSLVAPIYLLISVSFGFIATLGASVWLFTKIGNNPGLIFFLPILLFVFVVAIGTDYNILTITRFREELKETGNIKRSALLTIEHSGATVTSAGLILAGTFASLLIARVSLLTQLGFSIAFGVLLASYVIAPLLVPSVSILLGKVAWWP